MARKPDEHDDEQSKIDDQHSQTPSKQQPKGSRGGRRRSPDDETATSSKSSKGTAAEDPFAVETPPAFEPIGDGQPNLESDLEDELEPDDRLFDWTPERAGAVVRAGGYVLHAADRMGHVEGGEELWRATEHDARAAGEPLSRILNRYDSARRLAGMVDEAEFAAAMFDYARRNLEHRGRLVRRERMRQSEQPVERGPDAFDDMAGRGPVYQVPEPAAAVDEEEGPAQPAAYAFDPWAAAQ